MSAGLLPALLFLLQNPLHQPLSLILLFHVSSEYSPLYATDTCLPELKRAARILLDKGPQGQPSPFLSSLLSHSLPSSTRQLHSIRNMRTMKSRRSGGTDRGGIRKRGPTRTDRDGDMDMDRGGARGGKRARGETGRSTAGARPLTRDKTLDEIQKAISSGKDSQANIRQTKSSGGPNLETFSVRGWKDSKAASNRDGGVESLLAFLERRMNAHTKSGPRAKITKVCPTFARAVYI